MKKLSPKIIFLGSPALYLLSWPQQIYCTNGDCGDYWAGFGASVFGVLFMLAGGAFLTWFANPLLWLSWIFVKKSPILSLICSALSLYVALSFLSYNEIMVNEGGGMGKITGYALGYYLWVASIAVVLIGQLWRAFLSNIAEEQNTNTKK